MTKTNLIKIIDNITGKHLVRMLSFFRKPMPPSSGSIRNLLIIRPGGIGDAALLIPALTALKEKYPSAKIDVLAEMRNGAVFSLCPAVNRVFYYHRLRELFTLLKGKYDVVMDTEQWHRLSAVVAWMTNARVLIGFATNDRKKLFTHPIPYSLDEYEVNSFMNLIRPLPIEPLPDTQPPFLTIPSSISESIKPHLQSRPKKGLVAIFPGGSIPEKRWDVERFLVLTEKLTGRGFGVAVIGGKEDVQSGAAIESRLPHTINLCGKLSLPETAAVLKESTLLISGDSGILHIAYGLGIKTISLFGPGNTLKWAPRGKGRIVIDKHLVCSPCSKFGYTPQCKRNAECMGKITVEEVLDKAMELLER